jgi:hypothetical protein
MLGKGLVEGRDLRKLVEGWVVVLALHCLGSEKGWKIQGVELEVASGWSVEDLGSTTVALGSPMVCASARLNLVSRSGARSDWEMAYYLVLASKVLGKERSEAELAQSLAEVRGLRLVYWMVHPWACS